MIHSFIFWMIIVPAIVAFLLGLIASSAKSMANQIKKDSPQESPQ